MVIRKTAGIALSAALLLSTAFAASPFFSNTSASADETAEDPAAPAYIRGIFEINL